MSGNSESARLLEARTSKVPWRKWGPYLSERQWGTVREDYSPDGNAWDYFNHDQARSRAYHWGEDGLAGISDPRIISRLRQGESVSVLCLVRSLKLTTANPARS
jgi:hypothetical protein